MSRDPQRLPDYLEHILQAIDRVQRWVRDFDETSFLQSKVEQEAVIRNFEVTGEPRGRGFDSCQPHR